MNDDYRWIDGEQLKSCDANQCDRMSSAMYCCAECRIAWESSPRWDISGEHSENCNARWDSRQESPEVRAWSVRLWAKRRGIPLEKLENKQADIPDGWQSA